MATVMGMNVSTQFMPRKMPMVAAVTAVNNMGISSVKLFDWDAVDGNFIHYVANSNLSIALGIPNNRLADLSTPNGANAVVAEMINRLSSAFGKVRWICVGNEPLGSWYNDQYLSVLAPAVTNVFKALQAKNYPSIGVTVPQNFEFMGTSWPPSASKIKDKYKQVIKATCSVIRQSRAPFMVNIYPYLTRRADPTNVPLDYALFTKTTPQFNDAGKSYFNLFDAMLDALHFALIDIQSQDLEIVVGECGWPTGPAGQPDASTQTAQTFLSNLIAHCKSGRGTPQRPNRTIQCFVFELYDEANKDIGPGPFERFWGVCDGQGNPKFSLPW
jgi:Glycosyl hydrolases family 17